MLDSIRGFRISNFQSPVLLRSLYSSLLHGSPRNRTNLPNSVDRFITRPSFFIKFRSPRSLFRSYSQMSGASRARPVNSVPSLETAARAEVLRALEASLGRSFNSHPLAPTSKPLILVMSGPSGVGKDAVIKRLREVREGIHFVVTATSRAKRAGEVDGKDYQFISKEKFLSMVEKDELLEYALVYGDYKGIPKQQVCEYLAKGYDIILRVDIQGAATLRSIFGDSAVFIFLVAGSEAELVERLIDRNTETEESLMVRVNTAREELKHLKMFDYVVVNAKGGLDRAAGLVESILDAEKAKVHQRAPSL